MKRPTAYAVLRDGVLLVAIYGAATTYFTWALVPAAADGIYAAGTSWFSSRRAPTCCSLWILRWDMHALARR